jgi:adenylosuccinate lyase
LRARDAIAVCKLSGAVGTYSNIEPDVEARVGQHLSLTPVPATQVVARDRHAEFLYACASVGTTLESIAVELRHLQRTEVNEVREGFAPGQKGSSAMPHKRNPSSCEAVVGASRAVRYNVAYMMECMLIEHERDGSAWRGEWKALPESCLITGGILAIMKGVLSDLHVDVDNMRKNLDSLGGFLLSERVMFELSEKVGKQTAHDLVYEASMHGIENGISFEDALLQNPQVKKAMTLEEVRAVLDPTTYVGRGPEIVDEVIKQQRASGWLN